MLDLFFANAALAQEASEGGFGGLMGPLPMLVVMFAIFYFLLIRPQQKKAKANKLMLENIRKGDDILMAGGIFGRITGINGDQIVVEIAPQVRIKAQRSSVLRVVTGMNTASAADMDAKK